MKAELISEYNGHGAPVYKMMVHKGMLYTASSDKMLASWDISKNEAAPFSVKSESALYTFYVDNDFLILGASSGNLNVIDLNQKKEIRNLKLHRKGIYSLLKIADQDLLVTGGGDGFIHVFKYSSWELLRSLKISESKIRSIVLNEKPLEHISTFMVSCGDGMVREFETVYFNEIRAFRASDDSVNSLALHPKKKVWLTAGKDGYVRVWKEDSDEAIIDLAAHNMTIYNLSFNPAGTLFHTISRDKSIKIWNAEDLSSLLKIERKNLKGHTHSVNTSVWISDDEFFTAGDDRIIKRWKIQQ